MSILSCYFDNTFVAMTFLPTIYNLSIPSAEHPVLSDHDSAKITSIFLDAVVRDF